MNSIIIPAKRVCTKCSCDNTVEAKKCKGCGATFQFGWPDTPNESYIEMLKKRKVGPEDFKVQYLGIIENGKSSRCVNDELDEFYKTNAAGGIIPNGKA